MAEHLISAANVRLAKISSTSCVADDLCQLKMPLSSYKGQLVVVKSCYALHNQAVSLDKPCRSRCIVGDETSLD